MKKALLLFPLLLGGCSMALETTSTNGYTPIEFLEAYKDRIMYISPDCYKSFYIGQKIDRYCNEILLVWEIEAIKVGENTNGYLREHIYTLRFFEPKTRYTYDDYAGCSIDEWGADIV